MTSRIAVSVGVFFLGLQAQSGPVAFVDVTVVPMNRDTVLTHQTVLIQDRRISALGPSKKIRIPKSVQAINGGGRFLIPGLADMHAHLNARGPDGILKNEDYATLYLANGVTTVRNMWGDPAALAFKRSVEAGSAWGPQVFTSGPLTDGNPPTRPGSRVVETAAQATQAVEDDKRAGYDAIKVYDALKPDVYEALMATAAKLGLPVWGHVPELVLVERALELGQRSIEHVGGYLNALDRDTSPGKAAQLVAMTVKAGTWNCPTLVFYQGALPSDEIEKAVALRESSSLMPPALLRIWSNNPQLRSLTAYQFSRIRLYDQKREAFVTALHKGGAKLLLGTDEPNTLVAPGFAIHQELANLVHVGMTPFEALRAGTSDAALFLNRGNDFGTVAVGRRADLILLDANPLENVTNVGRRVGVMARGKWMPESELKARLERLRKSYPKAPAIR